MKTTNPKKIGEEIKSLRFALAIAALLSVNCIAQERSEQQRTCETKHEKVGVEAQYEKILADRPELKAALDAGRVTKKKIMQRLKGAAERGGNDQCCAARSRGVEKLNQARENDADLEAQYQKLLKDMPELKSVDKERIMSRLRASARVSARETGDDRTERQDQIWSHESSGARSSGREMPPDSTASRRRDATFRIPLRDRPFGCTMQLANVVLHANAQITVDDAGGQRIDQWRFAPAVKHGVLFVMSRISLELEAEPERHGAGVSGSPCSSLAEQAHRVVRLHRRLRPDGPIPSVWHWGTGGMWSVIVAEDGNLRRNQSLVCPTS